MSSLSLTLVEAQAARPFQSWLLKEGSLGEASQLFGVGQSSRSIRTHPSGRVQQKHGRLEPAMTFTWSSFNLWFQNLPEGFRTLSQILILGITEENEVTC